MNFSALIHLDRQEHLISHIWCSHNRFVNGNGFHSFAFCRQVYFDIPVFIGTIHYSENRFKGIPFRDLVRYGRSDFSEFIGDKTGFTQPH